MPIERWQPGADVVIDGLIFHRFIAIYFRKVALSTGFVTVFLC
ncbi:hypothetical protein EHW99_1475 [Erwinia amylovora]|uniref:Uncharacterized protein n=3 Tax=Erwinia amylovora TaxID=552 RepID=A0A830ZWL8_ERWAM|nr:hypothetical protein EaACW_2122 [Erwinia amylovora ACW56400]QJQ54180.1 hypothetical protein EHX00_1475 [Erwinia amylovora]CBA21077.1 hypothetical protein predicted by Glimmer/Critica [Erwinia amylovora CFBP1430]CBX80989.1 hypothetical protein predicted by Glimmer/Critica [Erwinia amylovora ATCC BAA-2158]CCO82769.1 hypothetical protein BN433_2201 [Erwinia amylovora Ea266]CCO86546.1 hypothetical protein BN434_2161 [Erwinia amylovora CFBP 2585]CCO90334.1 hypothetical protein BN435_2166 [Erwin